VRRVKLTIERKRCGRARLVGQTDIGCGQRDRDSPAAGKTCW
jgi:hypothetical protein